MPSIQHLHDFSQTATGWVCTLPNCTATLTQTQFSANKVVGGSVTDTINHTWKKAGN